MTYRSSFSRVDVWRLMAVAFVGFVLLLWSEQIADALSGLLPRSMTVSSRGTNWDKFSSDQGFGHHLSVYGVLCLTYVVLAGFSFLRPMYEAWIIDKLAEKAGPLCILSALVTAAFYVYTSYPHNGYPTNSYFHWVANHYESRFYASYVLITFFHHAFFDWPHLLNGLAVFASCLLIFSCTATLAESRLAGLSALAGFAVSGSMLLFADSAEGFHLVVAVILFCAWAFSKQKPIFFGISLLLLFLARPQYLIFPVAYLFGGVLIIFLQHRVGSASLKIALDREFYKKSVCTFLVVFLIWQLTSWVGGYNFFAYMQTAAASDVFSELKPTKVDGFVIYPFSGAYLLHLLWIFPAITIYFSLMIFRSSASKQRTWALFFFSLVLVNVLIHEKSVFYYFNVRYISYYVPIFIIAAAAAASPIFKRNFALFVVLSLAPASTYSHPLKTREAVIERPLSALFEVRTELREIATGYPIKTDFTGKQNKNYLSYIFLRPRSTVVSHQQTEYTGDYVLVSDDPRDCGVYPALSLRSVVVCYPGSAE